MILLKKWESEGRLRGIPVGDQGEEQLLYQLFADDTRLFLQADEQNFQVVVEVISIYKRISGALLNLEKSTIIPLNEEVQPTLYETIGCKVACPGEIINYLGCPM